MSRPLAPIPRIALNLQEAAAAAGVEERVLKGNSFHGRLESKRTSRPYQAGEWIGGLSWTGGRYLFAPEELARWLIERQEESSD